MTVHKTFCRNCTAHCPMELEVEDGNITAVRPDGSKSPYGPYICPKGQMAADLTNGGQGRLLQCYGRSPTGELAPLGLDAALDEIAARLRRIVGEHGPTSVAAYRGNGAHFNTLATPMLATWMAALGTPYVFSSMTLDQSAKWVTAMRMGVMTSGKRALNDVDVAITAGSNPVVSHQTHPYVAGENGAPGRAYAAARKRGLKLIVVDPRRTETARFADLHLQIRPGEDVTLFAGLIRLILQSDSHDAGFCARFVDGLEALRRAVAPFTPQYVEARAGVPATQLQTAANWLGNGKRVHCGSATGPSMGPRSNLADHLIEALNAILGGYYRAGETLPNVGVLKPRRAIERVVPPTRAWEQGLKLRTVDAGKLFGEFPSALLPDEILNPDADRIRALIVVGGNPTMALGEPEKTARAFAKLELLVVIDPELTETARRAHFVIAPTLPFERHDVTLFIDGVYPSPFAQYTAPVRSPPSGVIDEGRFFWELARRMDLPLVFKAAMFGVDYGHAGDGLPLDMTVPPDPVELMRWMCRKSLVPFDELLGADGGVRPDLPPQVVSEAAPSTARLDLCPQDVAAELATVRSEPEPATDYPYRLAVRRVLEAMNGGYHRAERTATRYPVNWAFMNPQDMAAEGIEEGGGVEISSATGSIRALAKADGDLRRGVVSMSHLFGRLQPSGDPMADGGSHTGRLVSLTTGLQTINYMPTQTGLPVRVRPDDLRETP
jgi:anaerobic selenocysteine-containing dehydrogenase